MEEKNNVDNCQTQEQSHLSNRESNMMRLRNCKNTSKPGMEAIRGKAGDMD